MVCINWMLHFDYGVPRHLLASSLSFKYGLIASGLCDELATNLRREWLTLSASLLVSLSVCVLILCCLCVVISVVAMW